MDVHFVNWLMKTLRTADIQERARVLGHVATKPEKVALAIGDHIELLREEYHDDTDEDQVVWDPERDPEMIVLHIKRNFRKEILSLNLKPKQRIR